MAAPGSSFSSRSSVTAESSSSSHSSMTRPWPWDVFLSFSGEEPAVSNFISDLCRALHEKGINTYKDDDLNVIEDSRVSVVVLSKKYASSVRCLEALIKISECKQTKYQKVLPVYYDVDQSDVQNQTNSVGEALVELEAKFKDDKKVQSWKEALTRVGISSGFHMENRYGSNCISEILKKLVGLICVPSVMIEHLIGIESYVKDVLQHLDIEKNDKRMIGIFGLGGIGKTSIAKKIYELIAHHFEDKCFLQDVREVSKEEDGLVQLQKTFLFEILQNNRSLMFWSADRGIVEIKKVLQSKRVLLVLDDVDQSEQLEKLAGRVNWFGSGSRIIITTRDKSLLINHKVSFAYKMKKLEKEKAFQLFSLNAFKKGRLEGAFVGLTKEVIHYAKGLPLVLIVLSLEFQGKTKHYWRRALDSYKRIPHEVIQEKLKISYERLEENEKNMFLDMACFFRRADKGFVTSVFDSCDYFPDSAIEKLKDKSLITCGKHNKLKMHALVQDMGREIVRQESPDRPNNRSRLVFHEDVLNVLYNKVETNKIEGVLIDLPQGFTAALNPEAIEEMEMLKFFINRNAIFSRAPNILSNELRLLDWYGYPAESMPSNFDGEELVVIKMSKSKIKSLSNFQNFQQLTIMEFTKCKLLTKIPDVSRLTNLKILKFDSCESLVEVDFSVGSLDKLEILHFIGCSCLIIFPKSLKLKSLVSLSLKCCIMLSKSPEFDCPMERLVEVQFGSTSIEELPSSFVNLTGLRRLCLDFCKSLRFSKKAWDDKQSKPSSETAKQEFMTNSDTALLPLPLPANASVSGDDCSSVMPCHENCFLSKLFCNVTPRDDFRLKSLDLTGIDMVSLPACILNFQFLRLLKVNECKKLEEISRLPSSLKKLHAKECTSLERFQFNAVDSPMFRRIDLIGCINLHQDIGKDVWDLLSRKGQPDIVEFNISFTGSEIPDWFIQKDVSKSRSSKLIYSGLAHLDGEIIGVACCAVLGVLCEEKVAELQCTVDLITDGLKIYSFRILLRNLSGENVILHYRSFRLKGDKIEVHFQCKSKTAFFVSCGVQFVSGHEAKEIRPLYVGGERKAIRLPYLVEKGKAIPPESVAEECLKPDIEMCLVERGKAIPPESVAEECSEEDIESDLDDGEYC